MTGGIKIVKAIMIDDTYDVQFCMGFSVSIKFRLCPTNKFFEGDILSETVPESQMVNLSRQ